MKTSLIQRGALTGALLTSLAACGGGGGGDGGVGTPPPLPSPDAPVIGDTNMTTLEGKVGITNGRAETADLTRGVTTAGGESAVINRTGGPDERAMNVTFDRDPQSPPLLIEAALDSSGDVVAYAFDLEDLSAEQNRVLQDLQGDYGSQDIRRVTEKGVFNSSITYIPADEAQEMYGALVALSAPASENLGTPGGSALFGLIGGDGSNDSVDFPSGASGNVTYRGVAGAYLDREGGSGYFEGPSSGEVNFDTSKLTTRSTLSAAGGASNEEITVTSSGSFGTPGSERSVTGQATITSNDRQTPVMSGDMDGQFYGPEGQTLGIVFDGQDVSGDNTIVGGAIMNRD